MKQKILDGKTSTGSSNAYVVWIDGPGYYDGQTIRFTANHANTGAATLAIKDKAAVAIRKNNDVALVAGDIEAGQILLVSYNATDNVFELLSDIGNNKGVLQVETITITTAELLALNTTPKTLVAAPAAGSYVVVDKIVASVDYNSVAYATNTTLEFRYTNGAGTKVTADIASLIDATADKVVSVGGIEAATVLTTAAPVVATVATGNPTAGNSDIKVTVSYRVLSI